MGGLIYQSVRKGSTTVVSNILSKGVEQAVKEKKNLLTTCRKTNSSSMTEKPKPV